MFARLLVGLDGSVQADVALEQAVVLARRFDAMVIAVYAHEPGASVDRALAERAQFRITAAGLPGKALEWPGEAGQVLTDLAREAEAVLVGRRSLTSSGALGRTAAALVRVAERCVVVCAGTPSPMRTCAVAVDGGESSGRALELAARFASVAGSALHVVHAGDPAAAGEVIGPAEAALSLQRVAYHTHVRPGPPAEVVAELVRELRADVLFAGAHVRRERPEAPAAIVVSNAEDILAQVPIPVVVQP
jgi:nucleotide-binding universal stress UspA family protein